MGALKECGRKSVYDGGGHPIGVSCGVSVDRWTLSSRWRRLSHRTLTKGRCSRRSCCRCSSGNCRQSLPTEVVRACTYKGWQTTHRVCVIGIPKFGSVVTNSTTVNPRLNER
jgi:hypothetical protein